METLCAVCASKAPRRCSSCSSVWYCSAEHQKEHWKIHGKSCPFFKVVEDPKLGKGLVATRNIKEGTLILQEGPVAVFHSNGSQLGCLSCGLVAGDGKCSKCKLPVCGLKCEKFPMHAENECQIFASKLFPTQYLRFIKDLVMAIRVILLKRNNPVIYHQILQLCPNLLLLDQASTKVVLCFLQILLARVEGLEINSDEIGKILRILHTNCHSHLGLCVDSCTQTPTISGLFLQSCRMNHSCIPNCRLQICSEPEFKTRVRTTSDVKKGEALTYFYYMEIFSQGTQRRQEVFQRIGNFRCECDRCKDPTELGTYMSGIVCKTCKGNKATTLGYLLPKDPLNLSDDAKWSCNSCKGIQLSKDILPEVEKLEQRISKLEGEIENNPLDEHLIETCKRLVGETCGIILHPNHWIIQKAFTVMGNMGRDLLMFGRTTMALDLSDYLIKGWKHLLSIHELLTPGLPRTRAVLLEQLATALRFRTDELVEEKKFQEAEISCEESLLHFKKALKFFEMDVCAVTYLVQVVERIREDISLVSNDLVTIRLNNLRLSD